MKAYYWSGIRLLTRRFSETNSYAGHGFPNVSDAGGAALWIVDYSLFGATLGIEKMFFHEGVGYKYNLVSQHYSSLITCQRYIIVNRSNRCPYLATSMML